MADTRTMTEDGFEPGRAVPWAGALVVLACGEEPGRMGEVALVRERRVLGRGPPRADDPAPRLEWVRQRPGLVHPTGPLASRRLSRVQALVEPAGDGLRLQSVGRSAMAVDGREVQVAEVAPGGLVRFGQHTLLQVTRRPLVLPGPRVEAPFGQADADGIVGESPAAHALRAELSWVAARQGHVLLLGDSGTGKELAARAIHSRSDRSRGRFVARNATTVPQTLAESELFGHAAGYPQAAMPAREGVVGAADGGTLFLDEIGDLPAAVQPQLLRVLDAGEYQRLGEASARRADLRCVGATNQPLDRLRPDLAARFRLRVRVPPLSERVEDVPLIARALLGAIAADDPRAVAPLGPSLEVRLEVLEDLVRGPLPGNVRDIEASLWRMLRRAAHPGPEAPVQAEAAPSDGAPSPAEVMAALERHGGVQERAWRDLGLPSRHALARLLKKYGLRVRRTPGR